MIINNNNNSSGPDFKPVWQQLSGSPGEYSSGNLKNLISDLGNSKKRSVYVLLAFAGGVFGLHDFYVRHFKTGLVCLILSVFGFIGLVLLGISCFGCWNNPVLLLSGICLLGLLVFTLGRAACCAVRWIFLSDEMFANSFKF